LRRHHGQQGRPLRLRAEAGEGRMNALSRVLERIPHRPPFLFVDEIVSETPDGLVARRTWRPEESFYQGHYPGAPITPGVLLCEAVFQAGALYLARAGGDSPGRGGVP